MKKVLILSLIIALTFCWSQANKIRKCQTSNCQVCSSIGVCVMCQPGHVLSINKQTMISQCVQQKCNIKNCFRCVNQNICAQCQTGFSLNLKSQCVKDNLLRNEIQNRDQFCRKKSNEGECLECSEGLKLIEGKCLPGFLNLQQVEQTTCVTSIGNCTACLVPNFCTACSNGLVPSATGNSCIQNCTVANCLLCSSNTACGVCQNGYTLNTTTNTCILCNITGCQSCSSTGICATCFQQYTINSNSTACIYTGCQFPCTACANSSAPTVCTACVFPYNPTPLSNGTCFTCSVANCLQCSTTSLNVCTACATGYTVQNGTCAYTCAGVANPQLCSICNINNNNTCTECVNGYTLTTNGSCIPCGSSPVCISCSPTNTSFCTACMQGYYNSNGSCFACTENSCSQCSNSGVCSSYQTTTGFQTFFYQNGSTQAFVCDVGCLSCAPTFPMQCLQCQPGFYIAINATSTIAQCFPCAPYCMTCASNDSTLCLTCYGNAVWANNNCTICNVTSNCLSCSSTNTTVCTSCPPGFVLSNDICTTPCPINCQSCFNATGTGLAGFQSNNVACTACNPGFGLSSTGVCLPCVYNCRVCSGQFQEICLLCGPSFYLNSNNVCTPCSPGCTSCVPTGCLACGPGYLLVGNNSTAFCSPLCPFPCASCSVSNPSQCITCLLGYVLNSTGSCNVNTNNQTVGSVVYCGFGSFFDSGSSTCQPCLNNCSRCSAPKLCTSCIYGYFLNFTNSSCLPCAPGCSVCSSSTTCVSCQSNYTLVNMPLLNNQPYCTQCALPCLQCTSNPMECLSCVQGFTFTGFNCLSNFYYYFAIGLQANRTTFYDNYQAFMSQILYALSTTNQRAALITTLATNNNIYVQMNLTTIVASGSDLANYEFNNLQFALMNQNTFGNMVVLNNTLSAQNGVIPTIGSSTPMICGIVIPIGVTILMGILYFIFSRSNLDLPGSNYVPLESPAPTRMTELRPIE